MLASKLPYTWCPYFFPLHILKSSKLRFTAPDRRSKAADSSGSLWAIVLDGTAAAGPGLSFLYLLSSLLSRLVQPLWSPPSSTAGITAVLFSAKFSSAQSFLPASRGFAQVSPEDKKSAYLIRNHKTAIIWAKSLNQYVTHVKSQAWDAKVCLPDLSVPWALAPHLGFDKNSQAPTSPSCSFSRHPNWVLSAMSHLEKQGSSWLFNTSVLWLSQYLCSENSKLNSSQDWLCGSHLQYNVKTSDERPSS